MKSLSDPFINRPVMTMLVYLAVAVAGIYSYLAMPVSDLPTVDYPIIKVTVSYPGASPEVMANNVASPLEQQFLQIPGIELVASNNALGSSQITLQFHLEKSIDGAASDVQAAIQAAAGSLPQDLPSPPTFQKVNPNDLPVIFFGMISYTMTATDLYDYAYTNVAQRIQTVNGVASVNVYGTPRAVRIEVDPRKLFARGLTFSDINAAVSASTVAAKRGPDQRRHDPAHRQAADATQQSGRLRQHHHRLQGRRAGLSPRCRRLRGLRADGRHENGLHRPGPQARLGRLRARRRQGQRRQQH